MATEEKKILPKISVNARMYYFYYKKIMKELKTLNWKRNNQLYYPYKITLSTQSSYNYDAFRLVERQFKRFGWFLKIEKYTFSQEEGGKFEIKVEKMSPYERSK